MAFCPNCGKKLQDDSRFCAGCGAPVAQAEPEQPQQYFHTAPMGEAPAAPQPTAPTGGNTTPTEPKKSGKGKYIAIFSGIAAVIAAVVLVFVLTGKDKNSGKSNKNYSSGGSALSELSDLSVDIDGETVKMDSYIDSKEVSALAESLSHGTVSIRADLSKWDDLGMEGTVEGILYSDPDAGRAALQATANVMGISLDATLYMDGTTLAIECGDLFRGAYGLDLSTMADDLQDSYIAQMAGLDTSTLQQIGAQSGEAMSALEDITAASQELATLVQEYMDFISEAAQTAGTVSKQDTTLDGVSVTQVNLTLDQNALADMFEKVARKALNDKALLSALEPFFEMYGIDASEIRNIDDEEITDAADELREDEGRLELEIYIAKSTGSLMSLKVWIYDDDALSTSFELYLGESFSKTSQISMLATEYYGDSLYTSGVVYEVINNTNTEYSARLNTIDYGESTTVAYITWDKSSGNYTLEFSEGAISGTLNIGTNSTEISITSYNDYYSYYGEQSMDLHLTFESGVSCPKAPSFKNILKLDEDDFMDLITEIQNSKLFSTIYQMADELG